MKQSVRVSIISGLVGVMLGAGSLYLVETNLDASARRRHSAAQELNHDRPAVRDLQEDGIENTEEGDRAGVTRGILPSF